MGVTTRRDRHRRELRQQLILQVIIQETGLKSRPQDPTETPQSATAEESSGLTNH